MTGKLYLCATPIGNLSDMSERLINTLSEVDLIAAEDTRHTQKLLNHLGLSKPQISYFEHNRRAKGEIIINELKSGKNVALVSDAGTPAISDPGEELVEMCGQEGIEVIPIPGPCAAICALIVSGLPTGRFVFEGFLPMNKKGRADRLNEIKNETRTLIFYEAPHKLLNTLADFLKYFGDRKISLCRELTKLHEQTMRTTVSAAYEYYSENMPKGEFVLVLEGAKDVESTNEWENISVFEHYEMHIGRGLSDKEAIKAVADERGVSKREIYSQIKIDRE